MLFWLTAVAAGVGFSYYAYCEGLHRGQLDGYYKGEGEASSRVARFWEQRCVEIGVAEWKLVANTNRVRWDWRQDVLDAVKRQREAELGARAEQAKAQAMPAEELSA